MSVYFRQTVTNYLINFFFCSHYIYFLKTFFLDFSVLAPKQNPRQMSVTSRLILAATEEEKTEILQHPVLGKPPNPIITSFWTFPFAELYLSLKWSRVCYFFYLWIFAYVVFVLSTSAYVKLSNRDYDALMTASRWISMWSAACLLAHAILEVINSKNDNSWRADLCCSAVWHTETTSGNTKCGWISPAHCSL